MRISKFVLGFADLLGFVVAFGIGSIMLIQYGKYDHLERLSVWWSETGLIHTGAHFLFVLICLVRFYVQGLYFRRLPFWDELRAILGIVFSVALLNGMIVLVAKWPFSRVLWLGSWFWALALVPLCRSLARKSMRKLRIWVRPTIVVGSGPNALNTLSALRAEQQLGFRVVGFVSLNGSRDDIKNLPVVSIGREGLIDYLKTKPRHEIFVALEESDVQDSGTLIEELGMEFPDMFFVPNLSGLPLFGMDIYHFFSHELLILRSRNNLGFRPRVVFKRAFDLCVSSILMIALSPLFAWIALRIRLSGPGILFSHNRVGLSGESFPCYKFRTMIPNAENVLKDLLARDSNAKKEWEEKMKLENDPRITPIGKYLRKTSLDELPQLWNVLMGDMSLVGPRPIVKKEMERYGHRIEFYQRVKPGITGLWQVSGRSDTDYKTRVRLDTWYSKNWTLWYDLVILFKTVKIVLNREGAY